jgi:RimJ/RimL family protein N-acetyltransferase
MPAKDRGAESLRERIGGGVAAPSDGLVIETERLLLRAPATPDAAAIAELADNPRVAEMLVGMPHPYRIADAMAWIAEPAPDGGQKHLVCLKTAGGAMPVGAATLDFRRGARLPTLGTWFGEAFWGRGYGTEAAHAVIDYAFLHQGHERLSFTCRVTNMAGRRVIEKCGFQLTAQELCPSAFLNAVVPVDRFTLDRRTWESLRRWEPLRFAPMTAR